jgi:hypothetical protein
MKLIASLLGFCLLQISLFAQYAPQAGVAGSDAIPHNSSQIVAWATGCSIIRGGMDIAQPGLGLASSGDSSLAIGNADNTVVSLGDSGIATMTFALPVINEPGPDFAVFENGFLNAANNEEAFLELAFIEVSSDGVNYFRFPATSLTQTTQQIAGTGAPGTGDYINARHINNFAGKYISKQGTPFDLEEMNGITGLDVNHITHVRIIDVIGSLGAHASTDNSGNIINDPYPTPFPTCGFDLDAVAVLHQSAPNYVHTAQDILMGIGPNPTSDQVFIQFKKNDTRLVVTEITGKVIMSKACTESETISLKEFQNGMYLFNFTDAKGNKWVERVVKY